MSLCLRLLGVTFLVCGSAYRTSYRQYWLPDKNEPSNGTTSFPKNSGKLYENIREYWNSKKQNTPTKSFQIKDQLLSESAPLSRADYLFPAKPLPLNHFKDQNQQTSIGSKLLKSKRSQPYLNLVFPQNQNKFGAYKNTYFEGLNSSIFSYSNESSLKQPIVSRAGLNTFVNNSSSYQTTVKRDGVLKDFSEKSDSGQSFNLHSDFQNKLKSNPIARNDVIDGYNKNEGISSLEDGKLSQMCCQNDNDETIESANTQQHMKTSERKEKLLEISTPKMNTAHSPGFLGVNKSVMEDFIPSSIDGKRHRNYDLSNSFSKRKSIRIFPSYEPFVNKEPQKIIDLEREIHNTNNYSDHVFSSSKRSQTNFNIFPEMSSSNRSKDIQPKTVLNKMVELNHKKPQIYSQNKHFFKNEENNESAKVNFNLTDSWLSGILQSFGKVFQLSFPPKVRPLIVNQILIVNGKPSIVGSKANETLNQKSETNETEPISLMENSDENKMKTPSDLLQSKNNFPHQQNLLRFSRSLKSFDQSLDISTFSKKNQRNNKTLLQNFNNREKNKNPKTKAQSNQKSLSCILLSALQNRNSNETRIKQLLSGISSLKLTDAICTHTLESLLKDIKGSFLVYIFENKLKHNISKAGNLRFKRASSPVSRAQVSDEGKGKKVIVRVTFEGDTKTEEPIVKKNRKFSNSDFQVLPTERDFSRVERSQKRNFNVPSDIIDHIRVLQINNLPIVEQDRFANIETKSVAIPLKTHKRGALSLKSRPLTREFSAKHFKSYENINIHPELLKFGNVLFEDEEMLITELPPDFVQGNFTDPSTLQNLEYLFHNTSDMVSEIFIIDEKGCKNVKMAENTLLAEKCDLNLNFPLQSRSDPFQRPKDKDEMDKMQSIQVFNSFPITAQPTFLPQIKMKPPKETFKNVQQHEPHNFQVSDKISVYDFFSAPSDAKKKPLTYNHEIYSHLSSNNNNSNTNNKNNFTDIRENVNNNSSRYNDDLQKNKKEPAISPLHLIKSKTKRITVTDDTNTRPKDYILNLRDQENITLPEKIHPNDNNNNLDMLASESQSVPYVVFQTHHSGHKPDIHETHLAEPKLAKFQASPNNDLFDTLKSISNHHQEVAQKGVLMDSFKESVNLASNMENIFREFHNGVHGPLSINLVESKIVSNETGNVITTEKNIKVQSTLPNATDAAKPAFHDHILFENKDQNIKRVDRIDYPVEDEKEINLEVLMDSQMGKETIMRRMDNHKEHSRIDTDSMTTRGGDKKPLVSLKKKNELNDRLNMNQMRNISHPFGSESVRYVIMSNQSLSDILEKGHSHNTRKSDTHNERIATTDISKGKKIQTTAIHSLSNLKDIHPILNLRNNKTITKFSDETDPELLKYSLSRDVDEDLIVGESRHHDIIVLPSENTDKKQVNISEGKAVKYSSNTLSDNNVEVLLLNYDEKKAFKIADLLSSKGEFNFQDKISPNQISEATSSTIETLASPANTKKVKSDQNATKKSDTKDKENASVIVKISINNSNDGKRNELQADDKNTPNHENQTLLKENANERSIIRARPSTFQSFVVEDNSKEASKPTNSVPKKGFLEAIKLGISEKESFDPVTNTIKNNSPTIQSLVNEHGIKHISSTENFRNKIFSHMNKFKNTNFSPSPFNSKFGRFSDIPEKRNNFLPPAKNKKLIPHFQFPYRLPLENDDRKIFSQDEDEAEWVWKKEGRFETSSRALSTQTLTDGEEGKLETELQSFFTELSRFMNNPSNMRFSGLGILRTGDKRDVSKRRHAPLPLHPDARTDTKEEWVW